MRKLGYFIVVLSVWLGVLVGLYLRPVSVEGQLYPKCLALVNGSARDALSKVWSVNDMPPDEFVRIIFDRVCGASPVIDKELAFYYLKNGEKISLSDLRKIYIESKKEDYTELREFIESNLGFSVH